MEMVQVRWSRRGTDLSGQIVVDSKSRSKIVFLQGYRPETAGAWKGALPGDGEEWLCHEVSDTDTRPFKGALIVRLASKATERWETVPGTGEALYGVKPAPVAKRFLGRREDMLYGAKAPAAVQAQIEDAAAAYTAAQARASACLAEIVSANQRGGLAEVRVDVADECGLRGLLVGSIRRSQKNRDLPVTRSWYFHGTPCTGDVEVVGEPVIAGLVYGWDEKFRVTDWAAVVAQLGQPERIEADPHGASSWTVTWTVDGRAVVAVLGVRELRGRVPHTLQGIEELSHGTFRATLCFEGFPPVGTSMGEGERLHRPSQQGRPWTVSRARLYSDVGLLLTEEQIAELTERLLATRRSLAYYAQAVLVRVGDGYRGMSELEEAVRDLSMVVTSEIEVRFGGFGYRATHHTPESDDGYRPAMSRDYSAESYYAQTSWGDVELGNTEYGVRHDNRPVAWVEGLLARFEHEAEQARTLALATKVQYRPDEAAGSEELYAVEIADDSAEIQAQLERNLEYGDWFEALAQYLRERTAAWLFDHSPEQIALRKQRGEAEAQRQYELERKAQKLAYDARRAEEALAAEQERVRAQEAQVLAEAPDRVRLAELLAHEHVQGNLDHARRIDQFVRAAISAIGARAAADLFRQEADEVYGRGARAQAIYRVMPNVDTCRLDWKCGADIVPVSFWASRLSVGKAPLVAATVVVVSSVNVSQVTLTYASKRDFKCSCGGWAQLTSTQMDAYKSGQEVDASCGKCGQGGTVRKS